MLFVLHATDRKDGLPTRAKFYRAHRIHLDEAGHFGVGVMTAGTLIAADGKTPIAIGTSKSGLSLPYQLTGENT